MIIKTDNVFSVIREINEILSLTNEPDKLVNTALDSLSQTLTLECCWLQTISDRKNQELTLTAERGFNDAMKAEISAMNLKQEFAGQIIGMGLKITIPDLNNGGAYGLDSFRAAGYKWVVGVPLMTYRCWGLLGAASRNKKLLEKDTPELIMVVGGLIANAWSKAHLAKEVPHRSGLPDVVAIEPDKALSLAATITETAPLSTATENTPPEAPVPVLLSSSPAAPPEKRPFTIVEKKAPIPDTPPKPIDPAFYSHTRKMTTFRQHHK